MVEPMQIETNDQQDSQMTNEETPPFEQWVARTKQSGPLPLKELDPRFYLSETTKRDKKKSHNRILNSMLDNKLNHLPLAKKLRCGQPVLNEYLEFLVPCVKCVDNNGDFHENRLQDQSKLSICALSDRVSATSQFTTMVRYVATQAEHPNQTDNPASPNYKKVLTEVRKQVVNGYAYKFIEQSDGELHQLAKDIVRRATGGQLQKAMMNTIASDVEKFFQYTLLDLGCFSEVQMFPCSQHLEIKKYSSTYYAGACKKLRKSILHRGVLDIYQQVMPEVDECNAVLSQLAQEEHTQYRGLESCFQVACQTNKRIPGAKFEESSYDQNKKVTTETFHGSPFLQGHSKSGGHYIGCQDIWTKDRQQCVWRECIAHMAGVQDYFFGTLQTPPTTNYLVGLLLLHKPALMYKYICEVAFALGCTQTLDADHLIGIPLMMMGDYEGVPREEDLDEESDQEEKKEQKNMSKQKQGKQQKKKNKNQNEKQEVRKNEEMQIDASNPPFNINKYRSALDKMGKGSIDRKIRVAQNMDKNYERVTQLTGSVEMIVVFELNVHDQAPLGALVEKHGDKTLMHVFVNAVVDFRKKMKMQHQGQPDVAKYFEDYEWGLCTQYQLGNNERYAYNHVTNFKLKKNKHGQSYLVIREQSYKQSIEEKINEKEETDEDFLLKHNITPQCQFRKAELGVKNQQNSDDSSGNKDFLKCKYFQLAFLQDDILARNIVQQIEKSYLQNHYKLQSGLKETFVVTFTKFQVLMLAQRHVGSTEERFQSEQQVKLAKDFFSHLLLAGDKFRHIRITDQFNQLSARAVQNYLLDKQKLYELDANYFLATQPYFSHTDDTQYNNLAKYFTLSEAELMITKGQFEDDQTIYPKKLQKVQTQTSLLQSNLFVSNYVKYLNQHISPQLAAQMAAQTLYGQDYAKSAVSKLVLEVFLSLVPAGFTQKELIEVAEKEVFSLWKRITEKQKIPFFVAARMERPTLHMDEQVRQTYYFGCIPTSPLLLCNPGEFDALLLQYNKFVEYQSYPILLNDTSLTLLRNKARQFLYAYLKETDHKITREQFVKWCQKEVRLEINFLRMCCISVINWGSIQTNQHQQKQLETSSYLPNDLSDEKLTGKQRLTVQQRATNLVKEFLVKGKANDVFLKEGNVSAFIVYFVGNRWSLQSILFTWLVEERFRHQLRPSNDVRLS